MDIGAGATTLLDQIMVDVLDCPPGGGYWFDTPGFWRDE